MKKLDRLRLAAYNRQNGLCCYCGLRMPAPGAHEAFAAQHGLSRRAAATLQCTAEHCTARATGGKDTPDNIAAAHRLCNARRHQTRHPLAPDALAEHVRARVRRGKWFPPQLLTALIAGCNSPTPESTRGRTLNA